MTEPDRDYLLTSLDDLERAGHRQAAEWFRLIVLAGIRVAIPCGVCEIEGCTDLQEMAVYTLTDERKWKCKLLCRKHIESDEEILTACWNCGCFSPVN